MIAKRQRLKDDEEIERQKKKGKRITKEET
jgi:hypothetical protein